MASRFPTTRSLKPRQIVQSGRCEARSARVGACPPARPDGEGAAVAVGLVYAEMQAAAQAVADAIEPLQTTLSDLGATIETEAGAGFKGQAAAGFGEAVNAWFDVAVTLGPILDGYAQSLMYVAQAHRAGQLADRLGGGAQ